VTKVQAPRLEYGSSGWDLADLESMSVVTVASKELLQCRAKPIVVAVGVDLTVFERNDADPSVVNLPPYFAAGEDHSDSSSQDPWSR
jgi:hypothetical protein